MSTYVKLQNGDQISTEEDPQALAERLNNSRRDGTLIKIDTTRHGPIWVNPHVLATIAPHSGEAAGSGRADVL